MMECHMCQNGHFAVCVFIYIASLFKQYILIQQMTTPNRQFQVPTFAAISLNLKAFHSILYGLAQGFIETSRNDRAPQLARANQDIERIIDQMFLMEERLRQRVQFFDLEPDNETISVETFESIMRLPPSVHQLCQRPPQRKNSYAPRLKHRGPYRSYSIQEKNHVVYLNQTGMTFAAISKTLEIPQKNVVRWCKEGYIDRDTSRRVADAEMEENLVDWMRNNRGATLKHADIQQKARELSNNPQFKASRGWLKNFLNRVEMDKVVKHESKREL